MTDWDAIFGEAALGLDLAKVDLVPSGPGQASGRRDERSSAPTLLDAQRDPADPDGPLRAARLSVQLTSRPAAPATDRNAIFRQEALEFRGRGRGTSGGVVRLGARWIRWTYLIAFVLLAAVAASMWMIRTDESASGPAVVDGRTGTVAALLPAVAGADVPSWQGLTITLPDGRSVRVSNLHAQLADAAAIREAGLAPPTQPAILVTGRLDPGAPAGLAARNAHLETQASVVLRSESLADVLSRQFNAMLGQGTAP
jgi:hypothetical protein